MLREAGTLNGCAIRAQDGEFGRLDQLYFDDESWAVRYLVVNTGGLLSSRMVLVSAEFVGESADDGGPNHETPRAIRVRLTKEQVDNSPPIEANRPVAAQQEVDYHAYHGTIPYWGSGWEAAGATPGYASAYPGEPQEGGEAGRRETGDPHLRSTKEITGYRVRAEDSGIGHVEDFVVDLEDWTIRYAVVDTRDWLPGKKTPVAPAWISRVSWSEGEIRVDPSREEIKTAPGWEPGTLIDRDYETEIYAHYGRTPYWVRP